MPRLLWSVWILNMFHSVKEPSKNRDIWVSGSVPIFTEQGSIRFGLLYIFTFGFGLVRFLAKRGFWCGSFLLGSVFYRLWFLLCLMQNVAYNAHGAVCLRVCVCACGQGYVTTAMESCLAAIAVLAIVASVWSLVISCRALSCCARVSDSQVIFEIVDVGCNLKQFDGLT